MSLPFLNGLRIIESSAFIAAPLAGLTLSQFGADVIRVDMIGGGIDYGRLPLIPGGRSLYWTGLNKTKRSVAIDLPRVRPQLAQLSPAITNRKRSAPQRPYHSSWRSLYSIEVALHHKGRKTWPSRIWQTS
jgi:hypothetical protein